MYTIKLRRDTAARWARINPTLEDGEPGIERDADGTEKLKIGDGSTPWNVLDYVGGAGDGTGPRGPQGIPGPEGPMGPEGPTGPKGLKGDKGDTGAQGPQGLVGPAGPQGSRGLVGPAGSDGQSFRYRGDWDAVTAFAMDDVVFYQGSSWIARTDNTDSEPTGASVEWDEIAIAGAQGPPGADGIQGPEGPQGPVGPRGNPGPQGIQGIQGNTGPAGSAGPAGPQGVQGPVGDIGPMGPTGADGAPGPIGADGPEGPQGLQGPEGDPGPTGADGAQGPQGLQGPKGDKGDPGDPGPQGIQGVAGPAGADGHSFNYRGAWDVATAYVVNDVTFHNGSSWIAVANTTGDEPTFASAQWDEIAIQGAQGAPGTDGAQGPQGIQGPAGADGAQGPQGAQGVKGDTGAAGPVGPQGPQGIQGIQGPQGAPGATTVAGLTDVDLTGLTDQEVLAYNSASGKWIPVAQATGGSGGGGGSTSNAIVRDATGAASVDVTGLDPTQNYDFYIDGVLSQGGVARWLGLFPNGVTPVNPGNVIRATLERSWTDAAGNIQVPTALRSDEHGLVLGALPFTSDQIISAFAHVRTKTGAARVSRSQMATGALGANVNETSLHTAASRMDVTNTDITHMVVDFGGGTFTGRVIAVPTGGASASTPGFVSALPSPAIDGQECFFKPDPTNATGNGNVAWHLKYDASSGWWYYVGGPPMYKQQEVMQQINGVGANVWTAPSVFGWNAPLQGDYDADYTGTFYSNQGGAGGIYVGWKVGATEPTTATGAAFDQNPQTWKGNGFSKRISAAAAAAAINLRMMQSLGTFNLYWENLTARLLPVRVK